MKVDFNGSVDELAYIFKVLVESGMITCRTKSEMYDVIVNNFRTKKTEDISKNSLKNKYNVPQLSAVESVNEKMRYLRQLSLKKLAEMSA